MEIMIEHLFRDRNVSWVRIENGINKYVTETSEDILAASVENRGTRKLVAKAKPRLKPTFRIMLADSCSDVGHFLDLDQRRNGTELFLMNQMETGTRLLNE